MADIVGTIIKIKDFISPVEVSLSVKPNEPQPKEIRLATDRKYSIPAFQRELRWDENNLQMLLSDLGHGPKFLGNTILTVKSDNTCEIIDGQQRTTVLMLIISCIKKRYGAKIPTPTLCPLYNESFTGFPQLLDIAFDKNAMSKEEWSALVMTDNYYQLDRILDLWKAISASELLSDRHKAKDLLTNILNSELNVIASYSDDVNSSIQYFLDVNLKGIRLDTEDIFKGYLFSQDDRKETRQLWQKNKCDVLRLNAVKQSSDAKRYPLMKLYEHFFYCDLYTPIDGICEFASLKFGEDFRLTSEFKSGNTKFYESSHLLEAIQDCDYLQTSLTRLNHCINIMIDIIESTGPSAVFRERFLSEEQINSIDIDNCHSMLKKILLEKQVIPKVLVLKYILTYFDGNSHSKAEYKSIYSIFCASVLFTIFANKKESETFYSFVRLEDWGGRINKWLFDYISSHSLTRGKMLAAYKYCEEDEDPDQLFRSKSLAAICNYFRVIKSGDHYNLKVTNALVLNTFFNDKNAFSLEHFIVAESGTLEINTERYKFPYKYPPTIQRYKHSLFNFIFIPRTINNALGNSGIPQKLSILNENRSSIACDYSGKYIDLLSKNPSRYFQRYPSVSDIDAKDTQEDVEKMLTDYFTKTFPEEFLAFSISLISSLKWDR